MLWVEAPVIGAAFPELMKLGIGWTIAGGVVAGIGILIALIVWLVKCLVS